MTGNFRAAIKSALLVLWIGLCCLLAWPGQRLGKLRWRDAVVRLCYQGIARIIGLRVSVQGRLMTLTPLLLVTNHLSYLDIVVLGGQPAVRFTPKREISGWPVIGGICRLCDAVFIDRRAEKLKEMKQSLQSALASGAVICLFPESTTGNGLHMQPFKSSLFSLAEEGIDGRELIVQPAAIAYTRLHRLPIDSAQWPRIAWYGDMELVLHLWELLKLGPLDAELAFLPPVTLTQCGDRKKLAAHCQQAIAAAIAEAKQKRYDRPKRAALRH